METEPQVTAIVKLFERGQLKAFADVTITFFGHELTLFGFRIVQKDGQAPWVALPTNSYEREGKTINKKLLECSRRLLQLVQDIILSAYVEATTDEKKAS